MSHGAYRKMAAEMTTQNPKHDPSRRDAVGTDEGPAEIPDDDYGLVERDEQDRANGAALRRLVEAGKTFEIFWSASDTYQVDVWERLPGPYCASLPEAVAAALGESALARGLESE